MYMLKFNQKMKTIFYTVLLILASVFNGSAQDDCPQPRVKVINLIKLEQTSLTERLHNTLGASVTSYIINQNRRDIQFFDSFVSESDVDYFLTINHDSKNTNVQILIKLTDRNNRVVLDFQSSIYDLIDNVEIDSLGESIAEKVSPLIDNINDHQHKIRNTSKAAIQAKFELEKLSYVVNVNENRRITFVLMDCDNVILPDRTVNLLLDGKGEIDKTTCAVDENGRGEFTYTAPKINNEQATVYLIHKYETASGRDNNEASQGVKIRTTGKMWLLVNHVTERAEIYIVGEHIGELEMKWDSENTRGGLAAAFSADDDKELWSSSVIELLEMTVTPTGEDVWKATSTWWPGTTTIKATKEDGFEINILWPGDDGTSIQVRGTITFEKPELFDQVRRKYLAAKRGGR